MGGQTFGAMSNQVSGNLTGVGALIMYLFALVGVIMTGMGIHGFYAHSKDGGRPGGIKTAAAQTIVGMILAGGLMYFINSGSTTLGAGTSSTLQGIVNP
jgi:peptidoglycan biosynthesis protein MviN/MurJ (putative lipid II flippase)